MEVAAERVDRDVDDRHVELNRDRSDQDDPRELQERRVEAIGRLHVPVTRCEAKLRYRSEAVPAAVVQTERGFRLDLDRPVAENLKIIAKSLNRDVDDLTVVILDRPRHAELIAAVHVPAAAGPPWAPGASALSP